MKFKYISNTPEAPIETTVFGYTFSLYGEPVEVTDKFAIGKLLGMKHAGFIPVEESAAEPEIEIKSEEENQNISSEDLDGDSDKESTAPKKSGKKGK